MDRFLPSRTRLARLVRRGSLTSPERGGLISWRGPRAVISLRQINDLPAPERDRCYLSIMRAGLTPGQTRPGLRMLRATLDRIEAFAARCHPGGCGGEEGSAQGRGLALHGVLKPVLLIRALPAIRQPVDWREMSVPPVL